MSEKDKSEYFNLDEVLENEVKFGKYQVLQFLFIAFPIFMNGICSSSYIFSAGTMNYRCKVPECDINHEKTSYERKWLNFTVPFNEVSGLPEKCKRFEPLESFHNGSRNNDLCIADFFNQSAKIECDDYIYENDEVTILNMFNLNCGKEFYLLLIGTINNVGQLFCYALTGYISDRYGRKIALIVGILGSGFCGIMRIFSVNYAMFASFEFLDSLFGAATYSTAYIIGLELVTPRLRSVFGTFLNCFYTFGEIYLGLIAMWFRNYKMMLFLVYVPSVFVLANIFFMSQSIRWLVMKGNYKEAKAILYKATRINKTTLSMSSFEKYEEEIELPNNDEGESSTVTSRSQGKTSLKIVLLIANISYQWFAIIFIYYGLNINSVYLEYWNKYISFIVVCSIELPSYFMANYMMDTLGRKKTLFIGTIGSGIFCIVSEFVKEPMTATISFVIGKLLISLSFAVIYIYTVEVFPTNLRHRFFSICSIVGRIGSILTPLTPVLAQKIFPGFPLIIFSVLSFSSSIFLCFIPETLNRKLPDTVDDVFI